MINFPLSLHIVQLNNRIKMKIWVLYPQRQCLVVEVQILFTVNLLCDPEQVTSPLCSSLLIYKLKILPDS